MEVTRSGFISRPAKLQKAVTPCRILSCSKRVVNILHGLRLYPKTSLAVFATVATGITCLEMTETTVVSALAKEVLLCGVSVGVALLGRRLENPNGLGFGVFNYVDGGKYEGYWKNGKRHDQGTMTWPSGDRYVGAQVGFKWDQKLLRRSFPPGYSAGLTKRRLELGLP